MSESEQDIEARVRRRAYELWEQDGRPDGRGDEFWNEAWDDITSNGEQASRPTTDGAVTEIGLASEERRSKAVDAPA